MTLKNMKNQRHMIRIKGNEVMRRSQQNCSLTSADRLSRGTVHASLSYGQLVWLVASGLLRKIGDRLAETLGFLASLAQHPTT